MSPACTNCYAERQSQRNPTVLGVWGPPATGTRVLASEAMWREPLRWQAAAAKRLGSCRVFCASIADVFEDWPGHLQDSQGRPLPGTMNDARQRLWDLIRATPDLTWMLLTKRPEHIGRMMPHGRWDNVWLGTTCESQAYTWRIDALVEAPQEVPVRFISAEPLLGPLTLWDQLPALQWVIVGGESGSKSRDMHIEWVRALLAQCDDARVACFVKQMGRVATMATPDESADGVTPRLQPGGRFSLRLARDPGHGGDMQDWPHDLRRREVPRE